MDSAGRASVQDLLDLGMQARRRADHQAALEHFQSAAAAYPKNISAKLETARTLLRLSRAAEAEAIVRDVLAGNPHHVGALLALGQMLSTGDRGAEAESLLQRACDLAPDNARALRALASLIYHRGDGLRARALLDAAIAAGRIPAAAQIEIAAELREQGHLDDARRRLEAAIASDRSNVAGLMELGRLERRCGHRQAASDAFKAVLQLAPLQQQALIEAAVEEHALGRPAEAERLLQQVLELEPDHLGALIQLAEHARMAEDDEAALKWSCQAMTAHPNALHPYLNASRAAVSTGRADTAVALLDHATTVFGQHPAIVARRLELLRLTGERSEALALVAGLPADVAANSSVWMQRVDLLLASGQYAAAGAALQAPPVRAGLAMGRVLDFRGQLAEAHWRFDEAAACYREALKIQDTDSWTRMWLARAQMLLLDLDGARENLAIATRQQSSQRLARGHSLNASQSFLGQILNEFMLDRDVVAELRQAAALPLPERVTQLQDIARRAPDNTAAAISLMVAMRMAGRLQTLASRSESQPAIPRRIAQYWNDTEPPGGIVEIMQSWRKHHPLWDYQRFDDATAQEFLRSHHPTEVLRAYMRARHPAQKADLFRLAYLVIEGGFYVDADDRCLAGLDTIVPPHVELAVYQEVYGTIGNNFLGARPGEPVLLKALELAVEGVNRGDHDLLWLSTGPGLMTRTVARFFSDPAEHDGLLNRALVLDRGELFQAVAVHCRLRYKRGDGHWTRSEFRVSGKPARKGAPGAAHRTRRAAGNGAPKPPDASASPEVDDQG